ncbi:MAG: thioredoxin family protein [Candidatus Caenarcaniphilales bacterium]|jgi:peroxiredoxin|nr:thioredoxin family protein [Candidatus Caenarcaniphilales bacterium]
MVLLNSLELDYGKKLVDFELLDTITGKIVSSKDLNKELAVIAFICNHCPYVVKIIDEFSKLARSCKDSSKAQFIAISANDPDYREEDSPQNMKIFAEKHQFSFPYLFDESQDVARAYGAVCTPDIFVYKKISTDYKLVYHARFEDLAKAIDDLQNQDTVSFENLPSAGCSIKWRA